MVGEAGPVLEYRPGRGGLLVVGDGVALDVAAGVHAVSHQLQHLREGLGALVLDVAGGDAEAGQAGDRLARSGRG
ncbi:hypothetical protein GCM10010430_74770 [Kitasatospora cystarginea]|uniref:STAS domain-containing protein n=1 Tax=Kitasatospora cystarginea TaxID=58350 RepID=A0ABP5RVP7_9ACTN